MFSAVFFFDAYCSLSSFMSSFVSVCVRGVFLVARPNPMLHFAPILSTNFFPCLNSIFKNGSFLSVVALVSVTLLGSNPPFSGKKDRFWHRLPPPFPRGLRQSNFPNVENDAGQKHIVRVFEKASPAAATPSQEHCLCPPLGFQPPYLCSRKAG